MTFGELSNHNYFQKISFGDHQLGKDIDQPTARLGLGQHLHVVVHAVHGGLALNSNAIRETF